jgi:hypothetical protein
MTVKAGEGIKEKHLKFLAQLSVAPEIVNWSAVVRKGAEVETCMLACFEMWVLWFE